MASKGKGNKKSTTRAQQQQQAAARRRPVTAAATGRAAVPAPSVSLPQELGIPTPVKVRHYVDISAVRIQDWLGRTPDLKFRRGGSVLLSESTERESWEACLPAGAQWNPEAGEVDGVVSLVLDDGTEGDPHEQAHDVARQIVQRMRAAMPHCPIQAIAGQAESYAAAYPAMVVARRDGDLLIDSPPAPPELFLAKPCDQCRSAVSTVPQVTVTSREKPVDLCDECTGRLQAAGRHGGPPSAGPAPRAPPQAGTRGGGHGGGGLL